MNNEKFFVKEDGKLVILYEDEGVKHIAVCEPIKDVVGLSMAVKTVKEGVGKGKGVPHCKKCGKAGHRSNHCPK